MTDLTLHNIMSEDMVVWAKLHEPKTVSIQVTDEDETTVYDEITHIYAWDSLVSFARQILACDEQVQKDLEVME